MNKMPWKCPRCHTIHNDLNMYCHCLPAVSTDAPTDDRAFPKQDYVHFNESIYSKSKKLEDLHYKTCRDCTLPMLTPEEKVLVIAALEENLSFYKNAIICEETADRLNCLRSILKKIRKHKST